MNEYVIETKQLTKSYGSVLALDHVTLRVKKGAIYGLVGDNGAGKSTLFRLLAGLALPTDGELQLLGNHDAKGLNRSRKHTGFIIEQPGFFPNMTVEKTLEYYRIQKGVPDRKKTMEMLQLTQIEHKRKSKCKNLSLGQKQRLGLAIAMLGEPSILILDEPINGLDPSGIIELRGLLHRLNEEKNVTLLLSSHILTELQQLATVYGFLNRGTLIEEISAKDLLEKCSDCIEIKLSDVAKYAALLEKNFPDETCTVLPDSTVRIIKPKREAESYSRLASENDILIIGMGRIQSSLEDYYMELKRMNGGNQA